MPILRFIYCVCRLSFATGVPTPANFVGANADAVRISRIYSWVKDILNDRCMRRNSSILIYRSANEVEVRFEIASQLNLSLVLKTF